MPAATVKTIVYSDQTTQRQSATFEGTGASQEIQHGFGTTWENLKIELVPLELDGSVVFSNFVEPTAGSLDHFHVTVTSGKAWKAVAESW